MTAGVTDDVVTDEVPPPSPVPAPLPAPPPRPVTTPPLPRARFAVLVSIGLLAAVSVAAAGVTFRIRHDLAPPTTEADVLAIVRANDLNEALVVALLVAHLVHGAAFGWFLHEAHRAIGRVEPIEGSRMAAASFLIPVVNLVAPHRAAKRVVIATDAPYALRATVKRWWLLFVGSVLAGLIAQSQYAEDYEDANFDGAHTALLFEAMSSVLVVVALVLAVGVVERLHAAVVALTGPRRVG